MYGFRIIVAETIPFDIQSWVSLDLSMATIGNFPSEFNPCMALAVPEPHEVYTQRKPSIFSFLAIKSEVSLSPTSGSPLTWTILVTFAPDTLRSRFDALQALLDIQLPWRCNDHGIVLSVHQFDYGFGGLSPGLDFTCSN